MNLSEIEANLVDLISKNDNDNFIYDLLFAFGISKTSITRLKKGDYNLAKNPGEVLYKNKIYFKVASKERLLLEVEDAAAEKDVLSQTPRFIIITDFQTIVARDLKKRVNADFSYNELPRFKDFFLPLTGAEIYKAGNDDKADREAAYQLAKLYDILIADNPDISANGTHSLNLFLSRLLFCFFAEDTGIFEVESIFTNTLANSTSQTGEDVHIFLNALFHRLNSAEGEFPLHLKDFPYVNGGLFRDEVKSPQFTKKSRDILLECGNLDWSEINPDIFGSMIQAVADPEERSDLGMHYTSVPNIKKLIEPLFLNDLYEEFEKNQDNSVNLKKLIKRISKIKFFDPACGSGNFLIITYKEIRLLEIKIVKQLIELDTLKGLNTLYFTSIQLSQFYGIEIKDFAHEMALLSLWLAEHQMNKVFEDMLDGYGKSRPILPLKEAGHIACDNAATANWEEVCFRQESDEVYIIGNPPYLGARLQDARQKQDIALVLNDFPGMNNLDYISIWIYKAKKFIEKGSVNCAFVSTNSICQGEQVALLWPKILSDTIEISFAYNSFKWLNNAKGNAGVTVIIIGLRKRSALPKILFSERVKKEVRNINAYLLEGNDIYVTPRSKPLSDLPEMNFGNMANDGGHLFLSPDQKISFIQQDRRAESFIKKLVGSLEFIRGIDKYCLWINDNNLEEASSIKPIAERINLTKISRKNSKRKSTEMLADVPHKFAEVRYKGTDAIFVPSVSSERREYIPIGFLDNANIIVAPNFAIYDAQPWVFGLLHSKMHMIWVKVIGGKLKTDYRYSAKLCYNTFPFPSISNKQKEILAQYVFQVLDERAKYPEKTMAWLYNPETMPSNLKDAHKELDDAIDRMYRLSPFQNNSDRLEYLFKLHEEMTKKNTLFVKQKKPSVKKTKQSEY